MERGTHRNWFPRWLLAAIVFGTATVMPSPSPAAVNWEPAATSASIDCDGAKAAVAEAKQKLRRAKRKLRKAKRDGSEPEIERARKRVRDAKQKLASAENAAEAPCTGLYMAMGDSIAGGVGATPGHGYVDLLFSHYRSTLGVTALMRYGGSTSGDLRANQLPKVVTDINAATDTKVVTLGIGAHDYLQGCRFGVNECTTTYRSNLAAMFAAIQGAFANDPGEELLIAVGYHNAAVGEPREAEADKLLLGGNLTLGCSDTGDDVGWSDAVAQEAGAHGALFADPYPAFKSGGQSYMADDLHPNDAGYRAFADAAIAASDLCAVRR